MSDIAIRVDNLGKQYRIGGPQGRSTYKSLRESLANAAQAPFRRLASVVRGQSTAVSDETIWALKDVSFEVKQGEVVGIIGRNGAGKTTLLKILSRITEPTEGRAEIHGRVGSLLEVGTGFHPELTGRENVYLNGAILGMKRAEIDAKFDEIVAFAEVERFLDTPVKHFSSGMYVRLAFAVAAHLDPEILLVDEVLAVGDAAFQKKCLGKMGEVARGGRTVFFVSHNMGAVQQLCRRAILLDQGQTVADGPPDKAVNQYLSATKTQSGHIDLTEWKPRTGTGMVRFRSVATLNAAEEISNKYFVGDALCVRMEIETRTAIDALRIAVSARDSMGLPIFLAADVDGDFRFEFPQRLEELEMTIPDLRLYPDTYYLSLWIADVGYETFDKVDDCVKFDVVEGGKLASRPLPRSQAVVYMTPVWRRL